jgi:hypothetical protein
MDPRLSWFAMGSVFGLVLCGWPWHPRFSRYSCRRSTTCGGGEITRAEWEAMHTLRRGTNPPPPGTNPPPRGTKPQPSGGRNPFVSEFQQQINDALGLDGYQPRPQQGTPNPPPREP